MCHDILKEEEDDEVSIDDVSNKKHLDDLLDEQNGNITAKLTNLTLNENDVADAAVNGNTITNENDRMATTTNIKMTTTTATKTTTTKKKSKKGTNSIKLVSTDVECDSNDNKLDDGSNSSALDASDDQSSIKDDVVDVQA